MFLALFLPIVCVDISFLWKTYVDDPLILPRKPNMKLPVLPKSPCFPEDDHCKMIQIMG